MILENKEIAMISRIGANAFAMYCYMKSIALNNKCDPGYNELQAALGMSSATVNICIKKLIAAGMLQARRNFKASTSYCFPSSLVFEVAEAHYSTINNIESMSSITSKTKELKKVTTLQDAQQEIMEITGWSRIPGDPKDSIHALGAVLDIYSTRSDAREWLTACYTTFRERYARSTKIFWLVDWAVQGVIPEESRNGHKKPEEVFVEEYGR